MYNQIENVELDSFTHTIKVFILGMLVAFTISIFLGANLSSESALAYPVEAKLIDCNDQASVIKAQDRSRNGIANGCPSVLK